jgi:hypothetical protein
MIDTTREELRANFRHTTAELETSNYPAGTTQTIII